MRRARRSVTSTPWGRRPLSCRPIFCAAPQRWPRRFVHGRPKLDAAEYDIHADVEDSHWWWRARRDILEQVIRRFAPTDRPLRLAELGCGTGGNLPMLARFGDVLGADANE